MHISGDRVEQPVVAMATHPGAWAVCQLAYVEGREAATTREGVRADAAARERHPQKYNHPQGDPGGFSQQYWTHSFMQRPVHPSFGRVKPLLDG